MSLHYGIAVGILVLMVEVGVYFGTGGNAGLAFAAAAFSAIVGIANK